MQMQEMKTEPYLRPSYIEHVGGNDEVTLRFPVPQKKRKPRWLLLATVIWMLLVMITAVLGVLGFAYLNDWIFPGVHVMQIDVGGVSRHEAASVLENAWSQQSVTLYAGTEEWHIGPQEVGVSLDVNQTVAEAYQFGRTATSWRQLAQTQSTAIHPVVQMDGGKARNTLNTLKQQLDQPAVDAHIQVENGAAVAMPAAMGRSLDVETTLAQWQTLERLPQNGRLPLYIQPIQPAIIDVTDLVAQANRLLVTTFTVDGYDPVRNETINWELTPDIWGKWLSFQPTAGSFLPSEWVLDEQLATIYFADQTGLLGNGRYIKTEEAAQELTQAINNEQNQITLRIYHHPTEHIIQSGESFASIGYDYGIPYPWLQQANPNVTTLSVGQAITIPSPDDLLPFPIIQNKRIVISIAQQRTWVYENGQLIWDWPVSTGIASSPTAPGVFQIQTHVENAYAANWNLWMPNFMGIYRPVPTSDFMNGFHGFPTRDGANLLWTQNLGTPVTYGCILLSNENAATLFPWAEEGVVVEIQP